LKLLDPVTWISVFPCLAAGVMASGAMQPTVHDYLLLFALFIMYGPLGTGFSPSVNDYYDLALDRGKRAHPSYSFGTNLRKGGCLELGHCARYSCYAGHMARHAHRRAARRDFYRISFFGTDYRLQSIPLLP